MDSPVWVYLLGLAGMGIYGLRILIQWYMSEKSKRVESPGIYCPILRLDIMFHPPELLTKI